MDRLDFEREDHLKFLIDLCLNNQDKLLNDHDGDITVILSNYKELDQAGRLCAYIIDDFNGLVWLEIDQYGVPRLRGAMLKGTLGYMLESSFNELIHSAFLFGFRKIEAEITLPSMMPNILYRLGFKKIGVVHSSFLKNGCPKDTVLLELMPEDYYVKEEIESEVSETTSSTKPTKQLFLPGWLSKITGYFQQR